MPILILVALGLALVIKTWVVQAFFIPSQSMENTLLVGDRVLVNKFIHHFRDIERGEVIVFNGTDSWDEPAPAAEAPGDPVSAALRWVGETFGVVPTGRDYIKRVVGVPGDVVACCDDQGRVTVNGAALDEEEYLFPGDAPSQEPFGPVTVGAGQYWVMGDHRSISYDSRRHQNDPGGGTIPEERVLGSAFVIVWPFERWTVLAAPGTFEQTALAAPGHVAAATPLGLGLAGAVPLTLAGRAAVRRWRAGIERRSSDR
nr:signal peptidase I [Allonocardiopsis opalescens]